MRVPHSAGADRVWLRTVLDGEPRYVEARADRADEHERWWRVSLRVQNPDSRYRFAVAGGPNGYRWLNAAGLFDHDVPDVDDFRLVTYVPPPAWLAGSVAYQVFPDRFASSGAERHWPSWARVVGWDEPVAVRHPSRQVYGGDLAGLEARLDHVERLGANLLYLTPFFPSQSSHRYDAATFDHVDPLLGGDDALSSLVAAAHRRGIRVLGDLTVNHSGVTHQWFQAAQADPCSPEAGYYLFRAHPDDYEAWLGVRSLPKFDLRHPELRRRLVDGPDSVVARFLSPPFSLDGWRVDVANMAGRLGDVDVNADVARTMRTTMALVRPDAYLVAEHFHDAHAELAGDGWHGTMYYAGFADPVWRWLADGDTDRLRVGKPMGLRPMGGRHVARTFQAFAAAMPWRSLAASLALLDSHDTPRFRTIAGSAERALAGFGLLLAWPGVPMLFAGDEVGVEGVSSDDGRRPFPWDERRWDHGLFGALQRLVAVRRASPALQRGGLRWLHAGDDVLVLLRESLDERVLVQVSRADHDPVQLPAGPLLHGGSAHLLYGDGDMSVVAGSCTLPPGGPAVRLWRLAP